MSFNQNLVVNACKLCLKYIFNYNQRVTVTELIKENIAQLTNLTCLNDVQNFICISCNRTLTTFSEFRTEAINNMRTISDLLKSVPEEVDNEEEGEAEEEEEEKVEVIVEEEVDEIETGYPYRKVFYEEYELATSDEAPCCSAPKKRKLEDGFVEISGFQEIEKVKEPVEMHSNDKIYPLQDQTEKAPFSGTETSFMTFLSNLCKRQCPNVPNLLTILKFCGYKNKDSFRQKVIDNISHKEAISRMECFIMPFAPTIRKKMGIKNDDSQAFSFSDAQTEAIEQMFTSVEQHIPKNWPQHAQRSKYKDIDGSNIQQFINERLSADIHHLTHQVIDSFPISRAETEKFPYKIYVPCIACKEDRLITVSEYTKGHYVYRNLRTSAYITHFKNCVLKHISGR